MLHPEYIYHRFAELHRHYTVRHTPRAAKQKQGVRPHHDSLDDHLRARLLERMLVHVGMAHIAACEEYLAKVSGVAGAHLAAADRLEGHGGRFEGGDKGGARQQVDAPAVMARPCGLD